MEIVQARAHWKTWFQIFCPIVPTQLGNIPTSKESQNGVSQPACHPQGQHELPLDPVCCFWYPSRWGTVQQWGGGPAGLPCQATMGRGSSRGKRHILVSSKDPQQALLIVDVPYIIDILALNRSWMKAKSTLLRDKNLRFWSQPLPFSGSHFSYV